MGSNEKANPQEGLANEKLDSNTSGARSAQDVHSTPGEPIGADTVDGQHAVR